MKQDEWYEACVAGCGRATTNLHLLCDDCIAESWLETAHELLRRQYEQT